MIPDDGFLRSIVIYMYKNQLDINTENVTLSIINEDVIQTSHFFLLGNQQLKRMTTNRVVTYHLLQH